MFEGQGQHTGYVASFHFVIHCFSDSLGSVLVKEAFGVQVQEVNDFIVFREE